MLEIEDAPVIDLDRAAEETMQSFGQVNLHLVFFLGEQIPMGFTEIKKHLFGNNQALMLEAASCHIEMTKQVGLYRISFILSKMQACVEDSATCNFAKYQAYYHELIKQLKLAREQLEKLPLSKSCSFVNQIFTRLRYERLRERGELGAEPRAKQCQREHRKRRSDGNAIYKHDWFQLGVRQGRGRRRGQLRK